MAADRKLHLDGPKLMVLGFQMVLILKKQLLVLNYFIVRSTRESCNLLLLFFGILANFLPFLASGQLIASSCIERE